MPQNDFRLDLKSFQLLLLEMAQQRSVPDLLHLVTSSLASNRNVALARVWMMAPGDTCRNCPELSACPDQSRCLHLMSSRGFSLDNVTTWDMTDQSAYRRFPLGVRKVGRIAATGQPVHISALTDDSAWLADKEWIQREGILNFVGQPLIFKGEVLGVLAMFTRIILEKDSLGLMRMIADHLAYAVSNARAFAEIESLKRQIESENAYLRAEVNLAQSFGGIIGTSEPLLDVLRKIELVAPIDTSVLITGESGTGKELVAREIHARSKRAHRPMIRVNCAAIPKDLFESEFFGHVRGAFTGAHRDREGFFRTADGGTLFLDEVSEIPLKLQGKLLRVLQEGEFQRVGEDKIHKVDVRMISATNRQLAQEVAAGHFREDLYYRLNVFPFILPSLRQRKEDIPLLITHFVDLISKKLNRPRPHLTPDDIEALTMHNWPGNIRELQNVIERAVITSRLDQIDCISPISPTSAAAPSTQDQPAIMGHGEGGILTENELRTLEKENIIRALRLCNGKIYGPRGAGKKLGVKPTTLISRMKKMEITIHDI